MVLNDDLNWYVFLASTNKKMLLPLWCRLNTNLFPNSVKLIRYLASAVNVVLSDPCVGPLLGIQITFFHYQYAQMSSYQLKN